MPRDKRTRELGLGSHIPAFETIRRQVEKRLVRLEAAPHLQALRGFPGNRLEALRGNRQGQYSIRVNAQWRICFRWPEGAPGPSDVEIVDYHN